MNTNDYITGQMLEDLGFELIKPHETDKYDFRFEVGYAHVILETHNLILIDRKNGAYHFAQRKDAMNGIGSMKTFLELLAGVKFATGHDLL